MKVAFFSTQPYDRLFFESQNNDASLQLTFYEVSLNEQTVQLAASQDAVCVFVNDKVNERVLLQLAALQVKVVALRCAGFNNVDIHVAKQAGIKVCRVPAYSPEAVAEHAVAMILTLNRKTHKAYNRVREQNFSLNGLMGFNLSGKTVAVVGTGNIGKAFCYNMLGFGCKVVAFDLIVNKELEDAGVRFLPLVEVFQIADIISLHCPLNEQTKHIINKASLQLMKQGAMLINTSRGGLVDTSAVIDALKSKQLAYLGIDVYEQEEQLFFRDLSANIIEDDTIQRLMSFPNVLVTAHQAFFTEEALHQITATTIANIKGLINNETITANAQLA